MPSACLAQVNSSLFMNAVSVLASAAGGVLMSWDFILSDDFYYSPTLNADLVSEHMPLGALDSKILFAWTVVG